MKEFFQYVTLVIIPALGVYIMHLHNAQRKRDKEHAEERKEWRESDQKKFDRLNASADSTHGALRENSNILAGMKALIETLIKITNGK